MNIRIGITVHAMSNALPECDVEDNGERKFTNANVTCLACQYILTIRVTA